MKRIKIPGFRHDSRALAMVRFAGGLGKPLRLMADS